MNKSSLKNIIIDQEELMTDKLQNNKIITRDGLEKCSKYLSAPNILLISGMRRAGKSFFSHLLAQEKKYAFINFDDERLIDVKTQDLNSILECFYEIYEKFDFLLLDEIQNIKGWELFINRLRDRNKIIITGSNANLLSHELATHLTGRYLDYTLFPLSFKEFLKFRSLNLKKDTIYSTRERAKISALFSEYFIHGGIFEHYTFGAEFTRNLFSSIITKDIVVRYNIQFPKILEELALLLVNSFASKISINKLTKHLEIKSPHTTKSYINFLENSFLIFSINKFSYKTKEQFSSFKKIYTIDNAIIHSLNLDFTPNKGRLLENLIAIELKRRTTHDNQQLFYWSDYKNECDFIVKKGKKIIACYQVCHQLTMENKKRELTGLVNALQEFDLKQGFLITLNDESEKRVNGFKINIVPAWKWLLSPSSSF